MKRLLAIGALVGALSVTATNMAAAQTEPYLGQVAIFTYNWGCPQNWLPADGRSMSVSSNQALFSLLGTTFGGNGSTTFNLPNLGGRAPVGVTPQQPIGAPYGSATASVNATGTGSVTLSTANLPAHTHQLNGTSGPITGNSPKGNLLATYVAAAKVYSATGAPADNAMAANAIGSTGLGQAVPISVTVPVNIPTQSPSLSIYWCVAVSGLYPQRP